MKLSAILVQIDNGNLALPKFQRGYVWNRMQVRKLMRSLYKGYPVGSLLVWETRSGTADVRSFQQLHNGSHRLLLDGQQRITTLYGIIRGKPPSFFDGNPKSFLNLYFNLAEEEFEFYGPIKMRDDPNWISVTDLMQEGGMEPLLQRFVSHPQQIAFMQRLFNITNIKEREFHIEMVSGDENKVDVVVDIFNEVNSGGTKLSKGDLALAKICADWPEARERMQERLRKWEAAGYRFNLDWLLRCINAILTGQSDFAALTDVSVADIREGLSRAEKHIDSALNLIASRLGLDDHYVLRSPNSIPAILRYLDKAKTFPDHEQLDQLLFWFIHSMLWGRYSGPTETVMRQDLLSIDENEDAVAALIQRLRESRGDLRIQGHDFSGATRRSRFFSMLYVLSRVYGTRDFGSGIQLRMSLLGGLNQLELHHIFPRALLRDHDFKQSDETNALANYTFLTKQTNLAVSARNPVEYFEEYEAKHPGVLASHWIPTDRRLWNVDNYGDFLAARRELLAKAANKFLDQLKHGTIPEARAVESLFDRETLLRPASIASDEEAAELNKAMDWMESRGLPRGEYGYELVAPGGELLATLDLAWFQGIQEGKSEKVALLIDESRETLHTANAVGFRYFTSLEELRRHVQRDILGDEQRV